MRVILLVCTLLLSPTLFAQSSVDELTARAHAGDASAENDLAIRCQRGDGVQKDFKQAILLFRSAAKKGYADAMFNLGTAYFNGDGVVRDDALAHGWFLVAAAYGSQSGLSAVRQAMDKSTPSLIAGMEIAAEMLHQGENIPANAEAAVELLEKASKEGSRKAQFLLAQWYQKGEGVPANPEKAWKLCQDGADASYPPSMGCAGRMLLDGTAGMQDSNRGLKWLRQAVGCGDRSSMFELGEIYLNGKYSIPADLNTAYMLFWLSRESDSRSTNALSKLEGLLSPIQVEKDRKEAESKIIRRKDNVCIWPTVI